MTSASSFPCRSTAPNRRSDSGSTSPSTCPAGRATRHPPRSRASRGPSTPRRARQADPRQPPRRRASARWACRVAACWWPPRARRSRARQGCGHGDRACSAGVRRHRQQRRRASVPEPRRRFEPGLFLRRALGGTARDAGAQPRPAGHGAGVVLQVPRAQGRCDDHRREARCRIPAGRKRAALRQRASHHRRPDRRGLGIQPLVADLRSRHAGHLRDPERDRGHGRSRPRRARRRRGRCHARRCRRRAAGRGGFDEQRRGLRRLPARSRAIRPERGREPRNAPRSRSSTRRSRPIPAMPPPMPRGRAR